jgi:hypothetical protein
MITKPKLDYRKEQPYAAIRTQVPIPFGKYLAPLWQEVQAWMKSQEEPDPKKWQTELAFRVAD